MPHPDLADVRARLEFFAECLAVMRARTAHLAGREDLLAANEADAVAVRHQLSLRLAALDQPGMLCFGAITHDRTSGGEAFHIGRRHIDDPDGQPAVVDWRAPIAIPFYRATAADALGLDRRCRYSFVGATLADIYDEDFTDPDSLLGGSGAHGVPDPLLAELGRERTGQMRDIVATIQAEQDEVIRAGLDECLIVQGGPGTGKTAVGLHRAAFLLYEQREKLARTGVLVIGPNRIFLQYIAQVLPSLGETSVTQTTIDGLFGHRFRCTLVDTFARAAILGDPRWSDLIANAARRSIKIPIEPIELRFHARVVRIEAVFVEQLVRDVQATGMPLRQQRERFRARLLREAYDRWSGDDLHALAVDEFTADVMAHKSSRAAVDRCWATVNPVQLIRSLLTSKAAFSAANAAEFSGDERALIMRSRANEGSAKLWSAAELPLLDEAEALVRGETRQYGHVVVDEAQDLSPMALRMVGRRALRSSLTILGDLAQATGPSATASWETALQHLGSPVNARRCELTVGYRLPGASLEYANRLLALAAPDVTPASSARALGTAPEVVQVDDGNIVAIVIERAHHLSALHMTSAVVAPSSLHSALREGGLKVGAIGTGIALLDPATAKGLEFDAVVVMEPGAIFAEPQHGPRLLFVALTRAVQSLTLVHSPRWPLPELLTR